MLPTKRISWPGPVATPLACSHRCCLTRCHACPLTAGSSEPSYHSTPSGTVAGWHFPHRQGPLFRRQASVLTWLHEGSSSGWGSCVSVTPLHSFMGSFAVSPRIGGVVSVTRLPSVVGAGLRDFLSVTPFEAVTF